ncbi:hypothetical protein CEUSTIGMA_g1553.t1, partial [Chlamydomonas eustigma]
MLPQGADRQAGRQAGKIYDCIVTFVDMFSKQSHFVRANKSITSPQLAAIFLETMFRLHGLPSILVSDRDTRITAEFWQTLFKSLGTKLNMSTANHPETDGQTERTHRTIEQILRAYVSPLHDDWATWLPIAEFSYNNHVHTSTQHTPFYINCGFHPTALPDLINTPPTALPDLINTPPTALPDLINTPPTALPDLINTPPTALPDL